MTYLRNTWYVAAWGREVAQGSLFARTLLDEPVLLFRNAEGEVRALHDQCPHRFVPLHMGKLNGERVQCGYHGLEFDQTGACVRNPNGEGRIPPAAQVRSYPVVERHSLVWIWMGDPALADPAAIPDFWFLDRDSHEVGEGYLHVKVDYRLEMDNILDLSHVEFVHTSTLGSPGLSSIDPTLSRDGDRIWVKRSLTGHKLSPLLYGLTGIAPGTPCDRRMEVRWDAPANMALYVFVAPTGGSAEEVDDNWQCHLFTPETEATTHYWYGIGLPKSMGAKAAELVPRRMEGMRRAFETEDLPMLEAQQRRMAGREFWSLKPVLLVSDGGAVQARRLLAQMIERERTAAHAAE